MAKADLWASRRQPAPASCEELAARAEALCGASLEQLAAALGTEVPQQPAAAKGWAGQLAEAALGADSDAGSRPDFVRLGVELKTIPVRDDGSVLESTFCCGIHMASADQQQWAHSRLRQRLQRVLWLPVQGRGTGPLALRRFGRACLWSPDPAQLAALGADWEALMGQVGAGAWAQLTAWSGQVLQVRPKAAHAQVRTWAPAADGGMARALPLGFYLRPAFTAHLLAGHPGVP